MTFPEHVGIIMDGNGRWAKRRGLPRNFGHRKGIENVERISKYAQKRGVKILSLFAFSTENWKRPKQEIDFLFSYLEEYLIKNKQELKDRGVGLNVMGRREGLPLSLVSQIEEAVILTKDNRDFILNIALNYGGRAEIVDAVNSIILDYQEKKINLPLNEDKFKNYLYSPFISDLDLLIRTSGEERISNFFLWRLAYSELYFTETLWPDFNEVDFDRALEAFSQRKRRFGGLRDGG